MSADAQEIGAREATWRHASELVAPIVEQHGLEDQKLGAVFTIASTTSKVDQHIDQIMRVADWLLDQP